jgi:exosortase/archaeosortase family protein
VSTRQRAAVALATAAAFWPTWAWYATRLGDGSDEKWGLLAIAAALVLALRARPTRRLDPAPLPLSLLVFGYAAAHALPPIVRAVPALLALALLVSGLAHGRRLHPGTAALLLLGLPAEATLQFYLGYPLRVAATALAALPLRLLGLDVAASGTLLLWRGEGIGVDAPCSGIHMLWVGLFLAALLAAARDLGLARTAAAGLLATLVVVLANGLRVAALFVKETHLVALPEWTHEAIGLLVFGLAVAVLLRGLALLEPSVRPEPPAEAPHGSRLMPAFGVACLLVGLLPLALREPAAAMRPDFPGWPETLDSAALQPLPPTAADARFGRGFPGRLARFSDGRRAVLLRFLAEPSRRLHPAADCFRGDGWTTEPQPARVDGHGQRWGCFAARRGTEQAVVCERILDAEGRSWTDASSWWWAAALGRAEGPYWAVTVVEPRT